MKKLFVLVLMVMFGFSMIVSVNAQEENRTIPKKAKTCVSGNTVVAAHGVTVYTITGYASSSNGIFSLINDTTVPTTRLDASANLEKVTVEGGQATQYNSITMYDFGDEGLSFDTGLSVHSEGVSLSVVYR